MKEYTIAFDFDGTITLISDYPNIGTIRPGIVECINKLYDEGFEIIIWTCRHPHGDNETNTAFYAIIDFLTVNKIKYHQINKNSIPLKANPGPKIYADLYVDDKSLFWDNSITGDKLYVQIKNYFNTYGESIKKSTIKYSEYVK